MLSQKWHRWHGQETLRLNNNTLRSDKEKKRLHMFQPGVCSSWRRLIYRHSKRAKTFSSKSKKGSSAEDLAPRCLLLHVNKKVRLINISVRSECVSAWEPVPCFLWSFDLSVMRWLRLKVATYAAALECSYHTKQDYSAYFSSICYFQWEKTTMFSPLAAAVVTRSQSIAQPCVNQPVSDRVCHCVSCEVKHFSGLITNNGPRSGLLTRVITAY